VDGITGGESRNARDGTVGWDGWMDGKATIAPITSRLDFSEEFQSEGEGGILSPPFPRPLTTRMETVSGASQPPLLSSSPFLFQANGNFRGCPFAG
jgi:hypothetical protein